MTNERSEYFLDLDTGNFRLGPDSPVRNIRDLSVAELREMKLRGLIAMEIDIAIQEAELRLGEGGGEV